MTNISEQNQELEALKEKIKSLEEEMEFLKEDLEAADEEVEELEKKMQIYESGEAFFFTRDEVKKKIKQAIDSALHNINLTTPTVFDLGELDLFEINANVNIKAACDIALSEKAQNEIIQELENFDNIDLRIYDAKDRWSVLIDGEKLIFGALGSEPNQILLFQTNDPNQIKLFNTLIMESWLRGKKLRD